MAFTPRTDNLDDVMAVDVNEAYGLTLTNRSGGALVLGDVVIQDTGNDSSFTTTNVEANPKVIGVVAESIANAASGVAMNGGPMAGVKCDAVAVTRGQYLITSTTLTRATSTSTWQTGVFAIALTAKGAGVGTVTAWLLGERPGTNLEIAGNFTLAEYIYHLGDADTFFRFQTDQFTLHAGGVDFINAVEAGTDYLQLLAGLNFIGDNANAKMTIGLTINQAGNDDEIVALKSSDVGHAITTNYEADTYGAIKKAEAGAGGLMIVGLKDGDGVAGHALHLRGILDEAAADTTKTTAAIGVVTIDGTLEGANVAALCGADENLVVIRNLAITRFIFDAEGTLHSIGTTAIDQFGNGKWFLNETANTKMTLGLTINQGANNNEIFALKSSDVGHGMTDIAEADTYGVIQKQEPDSGGISIRGFKDADGVKGKAANLIGFLGEAADDTKTTAGIGVVMLQASIELGAGATVVGANGNLVTIVNHTTTRFIFDAEGSAHADVEWIAFDEEDDIVLLAALESEFARRKDPIKAEFGAFLEEGREILQREKIVNFYDDGPRGMVNFSRLAMLHTGGIRQNALRITEGLESVFARLERYEQALLQLGVQPQLLLEA